MNRRNFVVAAIASFFTGLIPWRKAAGFHDRTALLAMAAREEPLVIPIKCEIEKSPVVLEGLEPVEYDGDPNDPRYAKAGDKNHSAREGQRCFVDGIDRTGECYECYEGEKGWANLYLRIPTHGITVPAMIAIGKREEVAPGCFSTPVTKIRYGVRATKVEWRKA